MRESNALANVSSLLKYESRRLSCGPYLSSSVNIGSISSIRPPTGLETLHLQILSLIAPFWTFGLCLCSSSWSVWLSRFTLSSAIPSSRSAWPVVPFCRTTSSDLDDCSFEALGFAGVRSRFRRFRLSCSLSSSLRLLAIAYSLSEKKRRPRSRDRAIWLTSAVVSVAMIWIERYGVAMGLVVSRCFNVEVVYGMRNLEL